MRLHPSCSLPASRQHSFWRFFGKNIPRLVVACTLRGLTFYPTAVAASYCPSVPLTELPPNLLSSGRVTVSKMQLHYPDKLRWASRSLMFSCVCFILLKQSVDQLLLFGEVGMFFIVSF